MAFLVRKKYKTYAHNIYVIRYIYIINNILNIYETEEISHRDFGAEHAHIYTERIYCMNIIYILTKDLDSFYINVTNDYNT